MGKKKKGLADLIRDEIAAQGLSGYRVSKDTGIPVSTIARFISGKDLTMKNAEIVLDLLGFTIVPPARSAKGRN